MFSEASERKRGCLHVESAIDSKERKGDSTDGETERTELGSRASRREGRRGDAGVSDGLCSHQRLDTFADLLAGARHLDLGLAW